ncbi:hypothetical protein [Hazenella coriacea]|uniref:Nucleic-acid-binding protein with Zn-ribbon domain DUF2082 n=1 Tax=Hazenella coriacea TaxID=1179467 RepID=A0A4R3LB86_9BACL|nr:hypothetical protein [Hazenella coriacea]TCS96548.1 nucleic-acid-binding protein with Zn-ribbon domain DUF2082 [Hazenella coriacea]
MSKKKVKTDRYQANGIDITCIHCQYDQFDLGKAQLNTAVMSFFDLDFLNKSAHTLTCHRCGYVHWFNKELQRVYVKK